MRNFDKASAGFTLVELVIAVGIIGTTFLTLIEIRLAAEERSYSYDVEREVRRLAQQTLDEVIYGLVDQTDGVYDIYEGRYSWSVETILVNAGEGPDLLESTITVSYPGEDDETQEYHLSTWFFPDPNHPLLDMIDSGNDSTGTGF